MVDTVVAPTPGQLIQYRETGRLGRVGDYRYKDRVTGERRRVKFLPVRWDGSTLTTMVLARDIEVIK